MVDEIDEPVGIEVRNADRTPRKSLTVQFLHRAPRAVVVAERLVDEVQVDVVEAETAEGGLEGTPRLLLALVLDPQLCRDEQLVSRNAARIERPTDRVLVPVRGGSVKRAESGCEGIGYRLFRLLYRDLKTPKPSTGISTPLLNLTAGIVALAMDLLLDFCIQKETPRRARQSPAPVFGNVTRRG